jgi:Protein of unknown function (DUF3040)
MALSMEEQRILAEIERQLAGDDPSLAVRLSKFGRPGLAVGLRTPRGRVLASFLVVAIVALLSLMVYSLVPLRVVPGRGAGGQSTAAPSQSAQPVQASATAAAAQATSNAAAQRTGKAAAKAGSPDRKAASPRPGKSAGRVSQSATPSAGPAG